MLKKVYLLVLGLILALAAVAGTVDPTGPTAWTLKNWVGFLLQTALFLLTVYLLYRLAVRQEREFKQEDKGSE